MNKYKYVAKTLSGKMVRGTFVAESEEYVKNALMKDDLFVLKIGKASTSAPSTFFSLSGRVSITELNSFSRQFAVLISSGISIIDSIATLKEQPYSSLLRKTLGQVLEDLYNGLMLSQSMKKYPKVFPAFYSSMVYVGETSGELSQVLNSVSTYYAKEKKNKSKFQSAMAYPVILFIMMIAVLVIMLHFVIPTFISSFSVMDVDMPPLTMFLFRMSEFVRGSWQYILLTLVIVIFSIYLFSKTKRGRYIIDKMKMTLPIFKKINIALFTSHFVQSLGLLLSSGLDMVSSLNSIKAIIDNKYLERQFDRVILDVKKGMPLSSAVSIEMKLSPVVIEMLLVGEKTGKLDKMLLSTSDYFDEEVEKAMNLITTILQPAVLSLLGVAIAVMFIAMYSPILNMITSIKT